MYIILRTMAINTISLTNIVNCFYLLDELPNCSVTSDLYIYLYGRAVCHHNDHVLHLCM